MPPSAQHDPFGYILFYVGLAVLGVFLLPLLFPVLGFIVIAAMFVGFFILLSNMLSGR